MGPLQRGIRDWDHIQTSLYKVEWIHLYVFNKKIIKIFLGPGLCLQHLLSNSWLSFSTWFFSPSLGSHMSQTSFPMAGLLSSLIVVFEIYQVSRFDPEQLLIVTSQCTHTSSAIGAAEGGRFPLKRSSFPHRCVSSLLHQCRSILHVYADAVMRLCCGCQCSIRGCWTFSVRILNIGLSPL